MLDITELQNEVLDRWENDCVKYFETENNGFRECTKYEDRILPEFQEVLNSPLLCIYELGYSSIAQYVAEKREENEPKKVEVKTYQDYLDYLEKKCINAPRWVKVWTKLMLEEK